MSRLTAIRDEIYLRILVKQAASAFSYANDTVVVKTWRPWETLEKLFDPLQFPHGKLYVIGQSRADILALSRSNAGQATFPIQIGFQKSIDDLDSTTEIDSYDGFVQEIEDMCRLEIDALSTIAPPIAFQRIEYMRDPDGLPLSFIMLREASLFEAYFTVHYTQVLEGNGP